jgi:hypothetical protein
MRAVLGIVAASCCGIALAFAQAPDLPKPETQDTPAPSANTSVPAVASSPAPELLPPDVLTPRERVPENAAPAAGVPSLPQLDEAFKQKPISNTAALNDAHAEFRQLKNRVVNRAKVKAAFRAAQAAPTDFEKRKLLRRYYDIFFDEMIAIAPRPEFVGYLNDRKKEQLAALAQPRVRPTPSPSAAAKQ